MFLKPRYTEVNKGQGNTKTVYLNTYIGSCVQILITKYLNRKFDLSSKISQCLFCVYNMKYKGNINGNDYEK